MIGIAAGLPFSALQRSWEQEPRTSKEGVTKAQGRISLLLGICQNGGNYARRERSVGKDSAEHTR